ncbi:carbonic anhydrase 14-like [Babylonia areolata]|uniref:carbonic anhydrase 14-like n=1 Tax=Babylonia areolata TaxID=304850 RepID=UPI003FD2F2FE
MEATLAARMLAVCFVLMLFGTEGANAATWSYDGVNGPHYWHDLFPQACSGKHQSPIDIRPAKTKYDPSLNGFAIWYDPPRPGSTLVVSNSGHTVQVVTNGEFYVANGGLPYVYRTTQFHFHWGHAKHHGSEHLIDGMAFPLELHIVSYNSDLYSHISQAVTEKQGLAILAVMFEMSDKDNKDLDPIIKALGQIRDPEARKQVKIEAMSLRKLLPRESSQYYRYNGSLTTPGCFESVVWTIFAKPCPISHRQLHKFRQLLQPRHRKGEHRTRRSAHDVIMPAATRRQKRRERRAHEVLDELGLSAVQKDRFRRELVQDKEEGDTLTARIDEHNAGETHRRMLEAVHRTPTPQEKKKEEEEEGKKKKTKEGEKDLQAKVEYIQNKLVNNFRPVQPINSRVVLRSFPEVPKTRAGGGHSHSAAHRNQAANQNLQSHSKHGTSAGDIACVASGALLVFSYLVAFLL